MDTVRASITDVMHLAVLFLIPAILWWQQTTGPARRGTCSGIPAAVRCGESSFTRAVRPPPGQPVERPARQRGHGALARVGLERSAISARTPMILAIDIGGTKFSMAAFDGDRMVRRESHATDSAGGREWMTARLAEIVRAWRADLPFERCGIGFGGPVDFAAQRVVLSTHVGGWSDFDLCGFVRKFPARPP